MLTNADKGGEGGIEMLTSAKNAEYYPTSSKKQSEIPNEKRCTNSYRDCMTIINYIVPNRNIFFFGGGGGLKT